MSSAHGSAPVVAWRWAARFGRQLLSHPDTAQVVIDLYLMALLAGVWMYRDARRRGRSAASVLPYWVLTALFVSVGPLLYIVINGLRDE